MELFHNRGVFNSFNEALDSFRPYSLKGTPYPWKCDQVALPHVIKEDHVNSILEKTKEKVLVWSSFMCGYLGPNDDYFGDRGQGYHDDYLSQIKEERLARLLAQEVKIINFFSNHCLGVRY